MNEKVNNYILGHPIAHSKSPDMYNAVYKELGLPWTYGKMDLSAEGEARGFLQKRDFLQINITTPYKPLAYEVADAKAATAKLAGGANVLINKNEKLVAYNVDGIGCVRYLEREGASFKEACVAVCGTGPTALAILHACAEAGAKEVLLLSRKKEKSKRIMEHYLDMLHNLVTAAIMMPAATDDRLNLSDIYEHADFRYGAYDTSTQAIAAADVVIDATPLGMHPGDPAPFDTSLIHAGQVVFDTVYGHGETALISAAKAAGAKAFAGAGMLVAQAVATFGILSDIANVSQTFSDDQLFSMMSAAAGFNI